MRRIYISALNAVPFLPYVYGLLRVATEEDVETARAYEFADPIFLIEPLGDIVGRIHDPAVLGLSCYIWNFRHQMKLARLVKERYPETLVVAGGPQVPDAVGNFFQLHPWVDLIVHGEGEVPFRRILRERLKESADWSKIPGISFQTDDGCVSTGPAEMLPREVNMPSPYLCGYLEPSIALCRSRQLRFYALWETNRGCPYACAFCDWGSATMSRVRRFEQQRLFSDIAYFGNSAISNIFICDANFGILPRDLDIAKELAKTQRIYGFPEQIRVNFAKNSNDRVFAISKLLFEHDMLMGTTLSMQSTDMAVLAAIDRQNIGIDNYRELKARYVKAGIPTYTELILALPQETKASFCGGIASLLEAGNHEDIRVYEFSILPNAPINDPAKLSRYGIETVERRLYLETPGTPDDEIETTEVVVRTDAMTREDWADCALFSQAIQFLHMGCWTRYIAIHLRRAYDVAFGDFYLNLIDYFLCRPHSVLGRVLIRLHSLYQQYLVDKTIPLANLIASQPDMADNLMSYGRRRGWTADDWGWLCLAADPDRFFSELADFLFTLPIQYGEEMDEVLKFQGDVILRLDYDPTKGKTSRYRFDFPGYYSSDKPLREQDLVVHFRDTHMGVNHQYPLEAGNLRRFAKAAIGESYPISRIRHYQHQLDIALISPMNMDLLLEVKNAYSIAG